MIRCVSKKVQEIPEQGSTTGRGQKRLVTTEPLRDARNFGSSIWQTVRQGRRQEEIGQLNDTRNGATKEAGAIMEKDSTPRPKQGTLSERRDSKSQKFTTKKTAAMDTMSDDNATYDWQRYHGKAGVLQCQRTEEETPRSRAAGTKSAGLWNLLNID